MLEARGPEAVTMRSLADEIGIRAPSLYRHFRDKRALEAAVIAEGLREFSATVTSALAGAAEPDRALALAYRRFGLERPHLYRLMFGGPLPRDLLPPGLEDSVAAPIVQVLGGLDTARAAWAGAHGLVSLELAGRFPEGADLDAAWEALVTAFRPHRPATSPEIPAPDSRTLPLASAGAPEQSPSQGHPRPDPSDADSRPAAP